MFYKHVKAFTLAEVLITLGIIGVVASMTIPSLLNKVQDKDLEVANKKAISVIYNALLKAKDDNGGTLEGLNLGYYLGDYIRLQENCNKTHTYDCWPETGRIAQQFGNANQYKDFAGPTTGSTLTADGMFIRIGSYNVQCSGRAQGTSNSSVDGSACYTIDYSNSYCGAFYIDVNGAKKPNQYGKDIREVNFWADGFATFPGFSGGTHTRWTGTRLQDDSAYKQGGNCYDGNDYSSSSYF